MASFPFRLMLAFLFAALVLNVSNYCFVRVYNAARENSLKTKGVTEMRRSLPSKFWDSDVVCDDETTTRSDNSRRHNYDDPDLASHSPRYMMSEKIQTTAKIDMKNCPVLPPGLGPEPENQSVIASHYVKVKLDGVQPGGIHQPANCKSLQSVAIIMPYRGCKNYLTTLMNTLHPFLMKQQLDYQIFVVEQSNKSQSYNRGKLLNVGFTEATRYRKDGFRCIILHDPYIVPLDSRNLYRCSWYPRQLAAVVESPKKVSYVPLLGGAIAVTPEQFLKFNGFSNAYWGNDADFYDLYNRINASNYVIENSIPLVGKYKTIRKKITFLWHKSKYLSTPSPLYLLDGLTSLSYTVDNFELRPLFTYLQVNIDAVVESKTRVKMYDKLLNPATSKTSTQQTTGTMT